MRIMETSMLHPMPGLTGARSPIYSVPAYIARQCCATRTVPSAAHSRPKSSLRWCDFGALRFSTISQRPKAAVKDVAETQKQAGEAEKSSESSKASAVKGVLFDMDGVLCDSEEPSREAAVALFAEFGVTVNADDFVPFMGTGEVNFLKGVAGVYGLDQFDPIAAKKRFFQIYIDKYAQPNSGLGYPGALDLICQCKKAGLKIAVASSADRIKVDANLAAAGLPLQDFDAVVSADLFENLKPAPDIFFAAAKALDLPPEECVVIEDALAGVLAARAAGMRCIAVTTTLDEKRLLPAGPSLVKQDISKISLDDLLSLREPAANTNQDSSSEPMQAPEFEFLSVVDRVGAAFGSLREQLDLNQELVVSVGPLKTRRDVLKLGSALLGVSSLWITGTHLKALSYVSPKSILNDIFGVRKPVVSDPDLPLSQRIKQFKKYLADLEKREGQDVGDFESKLEWLNAPPLSFQRELKGKVVILDFWTYCCINCMHILPDLAYLEKKYRGQPFTIVGVHSAKFDNEKDSSAIRNAVLRYDVAHPVVNDGEMVMWKELGVSSWPTLIVVSPKGKVIATLTGENHRKDLDDFVAAALEYYGGKKLLDNRPIPESLEKFKDLRLAASPLKFPGKLATDLANQRLFISDSNNHRIVVTDLEGNFILQIGGAGGEGLRDGSFEHSALNRPQSNANVGLAFPMNIKDKQGLTYYPSKNLLYVADTENHAIREIDFVKESVRTLAGTGQKGLDYVGGKSGPLQALNSPWDLCLDPGKGVLYAALAGQHQIWEIDLSDGVAKVFSGDGFERNLNGKRGADTSYAQPSGLSLGPDSRTIFIADSESSSIRSVDLESGGSKLLAGGDPLFPQNLFQFGDKDSTGSNALLQHPLGVLSGQDGLVYIADSYNHKVKVLEVATQRVRSIAGTGKAGFKDGSGLSAQLSEPAGLAQGPNGTLYIADTNNSLIRILNLGAKDGPTLETLELRGVPPPPSAPATAPQRLQRRSSSDTEIVKVDPVYLASGDLQLEINLPPEFHFTTNLKDLTQDAFLDCPQEAQSRYQALVEPDTGINIEPASGTFGSDGRVKLRFSRNSDDASTSSVRISCKIYYCRLEEVCLYKAVDFEVPFGIIQRKPAELIAIPYLVQPKSLTKKNDLSIIGV